MTDRSWIAARVGAARFEELAAGLGGSELRSLLLDVMHRRAAARKPKDLLAQYRRDAFCAPAAVDLRLSTEIDRQLLAAAEIHESFPCGKPLFIVGWNGNARRRTYHVPSSSWVCNK